jgi:hypothetical protein
MRANARGMVVAVAELEGRAFERVASPGGGRRTAMVEGEGCRWCCYGDAAPRTVRRHGPDGNK